MTSPCGPEPFISACTRQLSPFPPTLPFFPFPLCITSAATHSILQGSSVTHRKWSLPPHPAALLPGEPGISSPGSYGCSKPAWERLPQARLALIPLSLTSPLTGDRPEMGQTAQCSQPHTNSRHFFKKQIGHKKKKIHFLPGILCRLPQPGWRSLPQALEGVQQLRVRHAALAGEIAQSVGVFHSYCLLFSPRNPHKCDNCMCSLACFC